MEKHAEYREACERNGEDLVAAVVEVYGHIHEEFSEFMRAVEYTSATPELLGPQWREGTYRAVAAALHQGNYHMWLAYLKYDDRALAPRAAGSSMRATATG